MSQNSNTPAGRPPASGDDRTKVPRPKQKPKRRKKKVSGLQVFKRILLNICKAVFVVFCIGLMAVSVVAVQVVQYVVSETQNDDTILDLENIQLNQTSYIMVLNPKNQNAEAEDDWIEYQELVGPEHRIWVSLDEIPQDLINAVVATEDREFYNHHGVSFERSAYALLNEIFMLQDTTFGASTIDQQLVKNLTGDDEVVDEEGDRSSGYQRKMREIFRAWGLNNRYSKDMIMEAYLNTMGLSETIAGVQAGALEYFGKNVNELTLAECATIAGITQKPTTYSPFQNPEQCKKRRDDVILFMQECGYITQQQAEAAWNEPLGVTRRSASTESESSGEVFSYFSDAVFEEVVGDLMEQKGWTRAAAINYVYTGGLRIHATVELDIQEALEDIYLTGYDEDGYFMDQNRFPGYERALTEVVQELDAEGNVLSEEYVLPQSAAAVLNYDGELVAVVGGIGPKTESLSLNRAIGYVNDKGEVVGTVRQVGSTMKPIAAYALGLDFGIINYSKGVLDAGVQSRDGNSANLDWPKNYSNTYRNYNIPVCSAIAESTNTVAAQVGIWVGRETMFDFLTETLQVHSLVKPDDVDLGPLVLGSQTHGMSVVELAGAYMMFGGNDSYGVFTTIHSYTKIVDAKGNLVMEPEVTTVQAINEQAGYVMNRLLSNVLRGSGMPGGATGTALGMAISGEMDSVAKTGTTNDDKDRWLVGLTPYYVTAVWWGYDQEFDFYNKWSPSAYTNVTANVWKSLMETVQEDMEYKEFPAVPDGIQELAFCTISGDLAGAYCPRMMGYYTDFGVPNYCSAHTNAPPAEDPPPEG